MTDQASAPARGSAAAASRSIMAWNEISSPCGRSSAMRAHDFAAPDWRSSAAEASSNTIALACESSTQ